ncbi:MAG TPA: GntR family transcriptional regulator [Solirubrobacteraceae bacterium]|nr:GntR family transcriptional regulator [Solirubrobacteraceae bacterium]
MSATERAYDFTKSRILDGRFDGGALISEGEVAGQVGLSRTPVREAFLRLETEGLLRLYPKRGALVVPVSADEIEHVMETRLLVERNAIERVVRLGAPLADDLNESLARQTGLISEGLDQEFAEADREFHRLFVTAAGNPILLALHDSLRDRQSRMNLAAMGRDQHRAEQILVEHERLASAVIAGDVRRAQAILETHLQGTLTLLRPRIRGS